MKDVGWLTDNLGTIVVGALLLAAVVFVITRMIRAYRRGESCTCPCSSCPSASFCHAKKKSDGDGKSE